MRAVAWGVLGLVVWLSDALPVRASDWPAIVIPGKRGVPVFLNGVDASYMIVEGDYGLDRPGAVPLTIIPRYWYTPPVGYFPSSERSYFRDPPEYHPGDGRKHGYGRLERVPPPDRPKPKPAESYHRDWSAGSQPLPATIDDPNNNTQLNIEADVDEWGRHRRDHRPRKPNGPRKPRGPGHHR